MEFYKIIGIGLITCITALVVKQIKPEIALLVTVAGSVIIFLQLIDLLNDVFYIFDVLVEKTGISSELYTCLLKIIGVGYITEFSASLCTDSGNSSIADKIMLGGKVVILAMSVPIIKRLLEIIVGLLP